MEIFILILILLISLISLILSLLVLKRSSATKDDGLIYRFDDFDKKLSENKQELQTQFDRSRRADAEIQAMARKESQQTLFAFQNKLSGDLSDFRDFVTGRLDSLTKSTQEGMNLQKAVIQESIKNIQESNEKKLEQMRLTVDEKLNASFELVGKQLESVQKGLGEMQNLASDVGGLKRALTNVKTAGGMGEIQLETLLSDFLTPEQYEKNAHPNPTNSRKVVEFAVKIPSKEERRGFIYLPIDSKYPAEVWNKFTLAYEQGDKEEIENQRKALKVDVKNFARDIRDKYIEVPYTTEFGVMFIPFEGLYSEILRNSELCQSIQTEFHVVIMGPSTLNAFLNSLRVGFRTLAIEKKTSEVWKVLGQVKAQFGKFGDILAKTKVKLDAATREIENAEQRSRQIEKKLDKVEAVPESEKVLQLDMDSDEV